MISVRMMLRDKKLQGVISTGPDAKVLTALYLMQKYNIGALIVLKDSCFLGIVTERDAVRKLDVMGRNAETTFVREIWTCCDDVVTVSPEADLEDCLNIMDEKGIRHLPVIEGEGEYAKVIGVISEKDVVREIRNHELASDHIHGSGFPVS